MRSVSLFVMVLYGVAAEGLLPSIISLITGPDSSFNNRVAKYGFQGEEHTATTKDGYILKLFRIRDPTKQPQSTPVVVMHGLLQSSDAWIDSGPESGLGYVLASAGYDVWLANARGNFYSRQHVSLDPDTDGEFWKFSRDEVTKFDVPATIDKVLEQTRAAKVSYIGFSQGAGTFLAMCSELPDYCNKSNILIALAPSTRHLNTKSIIFRPLAEIIDQTREVLEFLGKYEVLAREQLFHRTVQLICPLPTPTNETVCDLLVDLLDGRNPGSITEEALETAIRHFPDGTSTQNMAWYGQAMTDPTFRKFDFGPVMNNKKYGSGIPPVYNLSAASLPVVVFNGRNDGIVDIEDSRWAANQLPQLLDFIEVEDPEWTHLDMTYSKDAPRLVYSRVLEYLSMYSEKKSLRMYSRVVW